MVPTQLDYHNHIIYIYIYITYIYIYIYLCVCVYILNIWKEKWDSSQEIPVISSWSNKKHCIILDFLTTSSAVITLRYNHMNFHKIQLKFEVLAKITRQITAGFSLLNYTYFLDIYCSLKMQHMIYSHNCSQLIQNISIKLRKNYLVI